MSRRMTVNLDTKDPVAKFAKRLRMLRADAGVKALTVPEAAEMGGVSPSGIYYALSGKRLPSPQVVVAIANAWGGDEKALLRARSAAESAAKGYQPSNGHALEVTDAAVKLVADRLLYADALVERDGAEWTRSISYRGDAVHGEVRKVLEAALELMK